MPHMQDKTNVSPMAPPGQNMPNMHGQKTKGRNKMTEFKYQEWHQIWTAVEAKATTYWAFVERFQIESKETDPDSQETKLWIHFLELAEEQTTLLNKLEKIANEHFPITQQSLFDKAIEQEPKKPARIIQAYADTNGIKPLKPVKK